jgi:hypothetical protein
MDYIYQYDNIQDYYRECMLPSKSHYKSSVEGSREFCYSDSMDETKERFTKGFSEGSAKARELLMQLTPFVRSVQGVKRGWKAQRYPGGNFILDNYVKGIPDICNTMSPVVSKKFCSIILNQTASAGIGTDVMLKRGIVTIALVNILEQNGYRVSIKVAYGERGYTHSLYTTVNLKAFNQTVETDRLAFFLADPSAFRRLNFAFMESRPEPIPTDILPRGYGMPVDLPASMIGEKDIYLTKASFNDDCWHSVDGAKQYLKETLKRYGIEFHG